VEELPPGPTKETDGSPLTPNGIFGANAICRKSGVTKI
jgi:hypothetical protein